MIDAVVIFCVIGFTLSLAFAGWIIRTNFRLAEQLELEADKVAALQAAVAEAREAFRRYAELHRAKGTAEGDKKALINDDFESAMDQVLRRTGYREPGLLQQAFINMSRKACRAADRAMERNRG